MPDRLAGKKKTVIGVITLEYGAVPSPYFSPSVSEAGGRGAFSPPMGNCNVFDSWSNLPWLMTAPPSASGFSSMSGDISIKFIFFCAAKREWQVS